MAFKKIQSEASIPESPEILFRDLPRRKIPDVMPNQREIMKAYAKEGVDKKDVAMQLPTGSGKTLVGLLIGEWRRRKFKEKVAYFCPTKQLVNQVVEQADEKYGLTVNGFVGPISQWEPTKKAEYGNVDRLAISTYSHLFNTNPFFCDADVLIFDDAHVAENYVASLWTLRIERNNPEHSSLHTALRHLLKRKIDSLSFARLTGQLETAADRSWVDKIPTPEVLDIKDELVEILNAYVHGSGLEYSWSMIQDHLESCHIYLSPFELLIRPLIPPTWTHEPFSKPTQRIYMSATLGEGGDLERLMGRRSIYRLPIPEGWDRQGVGRRFFIFPGMSLNEEEQRELRSKLIQKAGRALILVPNFFLKEEVEKEITDTLGTKTFGADTIESSKKPFIQTKSAVAIVANRYDGIDFPGDECRLLFIQGHPKTMNIQERFIMAGMGARILFNERIQTRILQAIGRCTRSLEDFSAVIVSGEEVPEYLSSIKRRKYFHPELQAEICFGVEQSKENSISDFEENFAIFLKNDKDWEKVNQGIVILRKDAVQEPFPALESLSNSVSFEIKYQEMLWKKDYEKAFQYAEKVLAELTDSELQGYRALWHYFAGSAAWLGSMAGITSFDKKAKMQFEKAKNASTAIHWLVSLARYQAKPETALPKNPRLMEQIERIERNLEKMGTLHDRNFSKIEKEILDGLWSGNSFENAHKLLGEFLGFISGNKETDGSPDPWWYDGRICFVFEDHADGNETTALSVSKARQVATHPNWIRKNIDIATNADIIPVLITPAKKVKKSAKAHLENVFILALDDFRSWAEEAIATIRELRSTFHEAGDLEWKAKAADIIQEKAIDAESLIKKIKEIGVGNKLKVIE